MASPQIEHGHIDIANTIADKLCGYRIPGQQWQIIWVVLRKTWGWLEDPNNSEGPKKKLDRIALSQFQDLTGIDRRKCHALLKKLVKSNVLIRIDPKKGDRSEVSYGFQKDFDRWLLSPKRMTTVTHKDDGLSPKRTPTKETIQKKRTIRSKLHFEPDSEPYKLLKLLMDLILERRPNFKKPNLQTWAKDIDKMIRLDKRDPKEIEKVIRWCQADEGKPGSDFSWQDNILSTGKLRKQYDQLAFKMAKGGKEAEEGPTITHCAKCGRTDWISLNDRGQCEVCEKTLF